MASMEVASESVEETEAIAGRLARSLVPGDVVLVEWPEAGAGVLPEPRVRVRLAHVAPDVRRIVVETADRALLEESTGAGPGLRHGD